LAHSHPAVRTFGAATGIHERHCQVARHDPLSFLAGPTLCSFNEEL
jgi:hypothetical protein